MNNDISENLKSEPYHNLAGQVIGYKVDAHDLDTLIGRMREAESAALQPAPQSVPDNSEIVALLGVMCGWFEILAAKAGWTNDNAGSAFAGYKKAKEAMLSAPTPECPSHESGQDEIAGD